MLDTNNQKGISIIFAMLIITVILGIAFGVSAILLSQVEMLRDVGYSVVAFYAADTGIENVLLNSPPVSISETEIGDDVSFLVNVLTGGENGCDSSLNYCIKSIGSYKETNRAIEIVY